MCCCQKIGQMNVISSTEFYSKTIHKYQRRTVYGTANGPVLESTNQQLSFESRGITKNRVKAENCERFQSIADKCRTISRSSQRNP